MFKIRAKPKRVMYENLLLFNFLAISLSGNIVLNKLLFHSHEFTNQYSLRSFKARYTSVVLEKSKTEKFIGVLALP